MKAKQDQEPEAGPLKVNIEYADSKGKTQHKTFNYGSGVDRQGFYDGVHELNKEVDKGKKE